MKQDELKEQLEKEIAKYKSEVLDSKAYTDQIKYLDSITVHAREAIRTISIYAFQIKPFYDEFLTIKSTDELIQSIIGVRLLFHYGMINMAKREIRYLLEMTTKYLIVDQIKPGCDLDSKLKYFQENISNSSIEIINDLQTPFEPQIEKEFKNEITDLFYKSCAFVHPSKKQMEEQLSNYSKGINVGFETAKMLTGGNKILYRAYDLILTMHFISLGKSMSEKIFDEQLNNAPDWKFHKGKYIGIYSKLFEKIEK